MAGPDWTCLWDMLSKDIITHIQENNCHSISSAELDVVNMYSCTKLLSRHQARKDALRAHRRRQDYMRKCTVYGYPNRIKMKVMTSCLQRGECRATVWDDIRKHLPGTRLYNMNHDHYIQLQLRQRNPHSWAWTTDTFVEVFYRLLTGSKNRACSEYIAKKWSKYGAAFYKLPSPSDGDRVLDTLDTGGGGLLDYLSDYKQLIRQD